MRGDGVNTVFVLVGRHSENAMVAAAERVASLVFHYDGDRVTIGCQQGTLVTIVRFIHTDAVLSANHEAVRVGVDRIDALSFRRIWHIALILSIVSTKKHFTIVCADEDHASRL